jgi:OmcA/MtrC family decaheme c-type cytochrome
MLLGAMALLVAGCGGGGGGSSGEPPGYIIPPGGSATISTAQEACWACHGNGGPVDVDAASTGVHTPIAQAAQLRPVITQIVTAGDTVAITVHVTDDAAAGAAVTTLTDQDIRFTFGKLVAAGASGFPQWQPLITNSSGVGSYERTNANTSFVNAGSGNYTYTLTGPYTGLNADQVPHRIGVQVPDDVQNGWADFTPDNSVTTTFNTGNFDGYNDATDTVQGTPTNDIVRTQTCNKCHGDQGLASNGTGLQMHGGDRRDVQYCILCHNPDNPNDSIVNNQVTGGENLDLKTMVHKIHMGKDLPSVAAGGSYTIGSHDFSKGAFPQPITNCEKCHTTTAWQNDPSIDACVTCHDRTWFGASTAVPTGFAMHPGGEITPTPAASDCNGCHPASGNTSSGISIASAHPTAIQFASAPSYTYTVAQVGLVTTRVSGLFPAGTGSTTSYRVGTTLPAVSGITNGGSGTTATITFATAHLMLQGATITVSGADQADDNGTFTVASVPSATTATYK